MASIALQYLRVVLEGQELHHPQLRKRAYSTSATARVLNPVEFDLWQAPVYETFGTLEADWNTIGFSTPPAGTVNIALLSTGETIMTMRPAGGQDLFLVFKGVAFRAAYHQAVHPTPRWPWFILQWADRVGVLQMLGKTVCLWPKRQDTTWGCITEPFVVCAVYAPVEEDTYGIGLVPALEGGFLVASDQDSGWPFRALHTLSPAVAKACRVGFSQELRPPIILWAPSTARDPSLFLQRRNGTTPVWRHDDSDLAGLRVLLPDEAGNSPDIWHDVPVLRGSGAVYQAVRMQNAEFCVRCLEEGKPFVPIVVKSRALCLSHYSLWQRTRKGAFAALRATAITKPRPKLTFSREWQADAPAVAAAAKPKRGRPSLRKDDDYEDDT